MRKSKVVFPTFIAVAIFSAAINTAPAKAQNNINPAATASSEVPLGSGLNESFEGGFTNIAPDALLDDVETDPATLETIEPAAGSEISSDDAAEAPAEEPAARPEEVQDEVFE